MDKSTGFATCKNAFPGCRCLPSTQTPGFECGEMQWCESGGCAGTEVNGRAICRNAYKGCACLATVNTPGFTCGDQKPCEMNECDGTRNSDGTYTCKNNFWGCRCLPTKDTPGFSCGTAKSCEAGGCAGTQVGGVAACRGNYIGCVCLASSNTPGFSCGTPKPCQDGGCAGTRIGGVSTCKGNYAGCPCIPNVTTPGFCGKDVKCSISQCQGRSSSGMGYGTCTNANMQGCRCIIGPIEYPDGVGLPDSPYYPPITYPDYNGPDIAIGTVDQAWVCRWIDIGIIHIPTRICHQTMVAAWTFQKPYTSRVAMLGHLGPNPCGKPFDLGWGFVKFEGCGGEDLTITKDDRFLMRCKAHSIQYGRNVHDTFFFDDVDWEQATQVWRCSRTF
jgi:hypothetical protein